MRGNSFANGDSTYSGNSMNAGSQRVRWSWAGGYQATVPPSTDLYQLTEWDPWA